MMIDIHYYLEFIIVYHRYENILLGLGDDGGVAVGRDKGWLSGTVGDGVLSITRPTPRSASGVPWEYHR